LQPLYHRGHSGTVPVTVSSLSYQSLCRFVDIGSNLN
jgi:hypothetical protein